MPAQAQARTPAQAAAPKASRRLSDQDLGINQDVFGALPLFCQCPHQVWGVDYEREW